MTIVRKLVTVRIDEKLIEKVSKLASQEKRSAGMQIEYIIEKFFEEYEKTK